jgi:hypothetical protein
MLEMSGFGWILRGAVIHRASLSYLNRYEFTSSDLFDGETRLPSGTEAVSAMENFPLIFQGAFGGG